MGYLIKNCEIKKLKEEGVLKKHPELALLIVELFDEGGYLTDKRLRDMYNGKKYPPYIFHVFRDSYNDIWLFEPFHHLLYLVFKFKFIYLLYIKLSLLSLLLIRDWNHLKWHHVLQSSVIMYKMERSMNKGFIYNINYY